MKLKYLKIVHYKNLQNFEWDIDMEESSPILCIIGQNGAGKSNLLEALVHIFECLNYNQFQQLLFNFEIKYEIENLNIRIVGTKDSKHDYYVFVDGIEVPFNEIRDGSKAWQYSISSEQPIRILPENLIVYYSGYSKRMHSFFEKVNADYAKIFRQGKSINLPPLLLIEPVHFKMILISLFSFDRSFDAIYKDFLLKYFDIESIESFSIHIQRLSNRGEDKTFDNFFDARGTVRDFIKTLEELQQMENAKLKVSEIEMGPFKIPATNNPLLISKVIYFFRQHESLINLKKAFGFESDIFKTLNVINQSGYLADITITIKKRGIADSISFDDFSEGEQQLLAIKGCVELLWGKSNLFIWDEPDTFLNPRWQWNLIPDLEKQIGDRLDDQFILTTHSPVLLSTARRGVFEMKQGKLSNIYHTYGLTVNETLIKQDIDIQIDEVKKKHNEYLTLIQEGNGKTNQAISLRRELEQLWGPNHPELVKANVFLKYYE